MAENISHSESKELIQTETLIEECNVLIKETFIAMTLIIK